jgi:hypothetical protein
MKKKSSLILDDEFIRYCEINKIENADTLAKETFARGFTLLKYGETPAGFGPKEKVVIKEVLKEVTIEVEKIVEVIKFVEVIKEVPVDKIVEIIKEVPVEIKGETQVITQEVIKEVIVEKLIDDYDCKNMIITLTEANRKLTEDLNKITTSLQGLNKAKYMKGSDLSNLYDE